jgi:hypothetical protein
MMKVLRILNSSGDTCIEFDATEATAEAAAKAKALFDDWMAKKLPAFLTKRPEGKQDEKITSFDQIEEGAETILVPAIVAG